MGLSKLNQLYRYVIMEHNEHPQHFGLKETDSSYLIEMHNPSCGDEITVELIFDQDKQYIEETRFTGQGCAISKASASMMTQVFNGISLEEAKHRADLFSQMVLGQEGDYSSLGDASILEVVQTFPARINCATLAWKAVQNFDETSSDTHRREEIK